MRGLHFAGIGRPKASFVSVTESVGPLLSALPSRGAVPMSPGSGGLMASLGAGHDAACIFIDAGAGGRAARFVRTSL